ncbi:MAG: lipoprotein-releasing ABC transporter permease subunit [Pseudomonadota bacterium]
MTEPIDDGGDDRDDLHDDMRGGWGRGDDGDARRRAAEQARAEDRTTAQLARLRDGLSRGVGRGPARRAASEDSLRAARRQAPPPSTPADPDPQAHSPARRGGAGAGARQSGGSARSGSLDRAIDRVGGLMDDLGSGSGAEAVRDPYADYDDAPPAGGDQTAFGPADAYDAPPAPESRAPDRRDGRGRRSGYGFDDDMDSLRAHREAAPAPRAPAGRIDPFAAPEPRRDADFDPEREAEPRPRRDRRAGAGPLRGGPDPQDQVADADVAGYMGRGAVSDDMDDVREAEPAFQEEIGAGLASSARLRRSQEADHRDFDPGDFDPGNFDAGDFDARETEAPPAREARRGLRTRRARRGDDVDTPLARDGDQGGDGADGDGGGRARRKKRNAPAVMDPNAAAEAAAASRGRGSSAFGSFERMLAGRYLRARRKEGFISVIAMLSLIGITLAVAVLIVVMSVMNGFRAELIDKMVGVNGHLIVFPEERSFEQPDDTAQAIRAVPGVTRAAPMIEAQAFATSARGGSGVLVRGLAKADLMSLEQVSVTPEAGVGGLGLYGEGDGIAIAAGLAQKLGVTVGDTIHILSPTGSVTPFGVTPKRRTFDILYVFKLGMSIYDDALVFMPIDKAQSFFGRQGAADFIEVKVVSPEELDGYEVDVIEAAEQPVRIQTWKSSNSTLLGALQTEQSVMFLILSMLILIASLIIVSGLIMLVKEKGADIAILRTMGVSRGGVMRVFFMCGAAIGVIGTVIGVGLGVVVALNVNDIKEFIEANTGAQLFPSEVYLFSSLPSRLDWGDVGFTMAITLGLSFLATLYPAWRATQIEPVEALRYE